jgi:hypothetical protein
LTYLSPGLHSAVTLECCPHDREIGLTLPVATAVNKIVNEGVSIEAAFGELIGRPTGAELYCSVATPS